MNWSRNVVNRQVNRIRSVFAWAVAQELIPASVHHGFQAVAGLKRGRSDARDTEPVKPVPDAHVEAVRPYVSRQVWALVQLQLLTGARPGELLPMRPLDLDTRGDVWVYAPRAQDRAPRARAHDPPRGAGA
ncbi:MAG: tyrosine-type recombinase/integrase, partial [Tepidisphaeraceae bacterium]